jgi:3-isopropylmalate/(R)-2-methylmalate dehydratase large subunit
MAQSLFEKIWNAHVVRYVGDDMYLLHIDRHILQDASSSRAFDGLRAAGRKVRSPELTFAVVDHVVSTRVGRTIRSNPDGSELISEMERNCRESGIMLFGLGDRRQGIEHVVAPELGLVLPGTTVVCADSHTSTNGALGAFAWGFGTGDIEHVLATQTALKTKPRAMRITLRGSPGYMVHAKDVILHLIGRIGVTGARGYAVEYTGSTIAAMSIEERMTVCNMSAELGARSGMIAPDDKTFEYLFGREFSPRGQQWDSALTYWKTLRSDDGAAFDKDVVLDCTEISPQITWGVTPEDVIDVDATIPSPDGVVSETHRSKIRRSLDYMGLEAGRPIAGTPIDVAFIGSCTNSRLSDLQAAASIVRGRKVAPNVRALVVPGSTTVRREAEREGLDRVFSDAGFEWRESGCSMCLAINDDQVPAGQRCISTSNRNFENRQGPGSRTHLASPVSVAAAAITGVITDARTLSA